MPSASSSPSTLALLAGLLTVALVALPEVDLSWDAHAQAQVAQAQGDHERAMVIVREALALSRRMGDKWGTAGAIPKHFPSVSVNSKHDKNRKSRENLTCIIWMNQDLPSILIFPIPTVCLTFAPHCMT